MDTKTFTLTRPKFMIDQDVEKISTHGATEELKQMLLVFSSDGKSFRRLKAAGAYLLQSRNTEEVVQECRELYRPFCSIFLSAAGEY